MDNRIETVPNGAQKTIATCEVIRTVVTVITGLATIAGIGIGIKFGKTIAQTMGMIPADNDNKDENKDEE